MRKKFIEFPLLNAVKLVPRKGKTDVTVITTGEVDIIDPAPSAEPRERCIEMAKTSHGHITKSPAGLNTTLKIILPTVIATKENFLLEVHALFDLMKLEEIEMERNLG